MTDEQRLQMITDQLILVRDNLFRGMSKSIQKLQARSINEVLELPNHTQSPPTQQEPVAIALNTGTKQGVKWLKNVEHGEHLYTSPPAQRTWVGLTNNELQPIADEYRILFGSWVEDFARAIEAKLKEKNT